MALPIWLLTSLSHQGESASPSSKKETYTKWHNHGSDILPSLPYAIGWKQVSGPTHTVGGNYTKGRTAEGGESRVQP